MNEPCAFSSPLRRRASCSCLRCCCFRLEFCLCVWCLYVCGVCVLLLPCLFVVLIVGVGGVSEGDTIQRFHY